MNSPVVKKIMGYIENYIGYVICLCGIFCILGVFIPNKLVYSGWGMNESEKLGNYFKWGYSGKAIVVIIFTAVCVLSVTMLKKYNNMTFGAIAAVAALIVLIVAGVGGSLSYSTMGVSVKLKGGVNLIKVFRILMFIFSLINAAVICIKKFVIKDTEA